MKNFPVLKTLVALLVVAAVAVGISLLVGSFTWLAYVGIALAAVIAVVAVISIIALVYIKCHVAVHEFLFSYKQNRRLKKQGINPEDYWVKPL